MLPGQTNSWLIRSPLVLADGGLYSVTASNASGLATASATLSVRLKPDLRITEVQSSQSADAMGKTADWWELTSFEAQPVSLKGWRFNDSAGGLDTAYTITNELTLAPGESVVLVEDISPAKFLKWWGTNQFPTHFQILSYSGSGLGLAAEGDGLRLWTDSATDPADTVAAVDFGVADPGVSFNYDPVSGLFGAKSQLGVNGVFRAETGSDLGSPGRILAPPASPELRVTLAGDRLQLRFDGAVGREYGLETRNGLGDGAGWVPTGDTLLATNNQVLRFEKPLAPDSRFYRVTVN